MKRATPKAYSFDEAYLKRTKLEDFLAAFEHHKDLPLKQIWDKANKK